jgi:gliding motility-associated lipoprotein GldH
MFYLRNRFLFFLCLQFIACNLWLSSCNTIDLYEKVVAIPKHQWQSSFKPEFKFTIKDTASAYQLYVTIRHNNKYGYNNMWLKLHAKAPGDTAQKINLEIPLANKDGWIGNGMDDIFEHRIAFALDPQKFNFLKAGEYSFTLEQIMRDDPLPEIMNVGIRIEKKAQ